MKGIPFFVPFILLFRIALDLINLMLFSRSYAGNYMYFWYFSYARSQRDAAHK